MLGNLLFKINQNFGRIIFKNPNMLYYNLFNFFHKKLIANDNDNYFIKEFLNTGYLKTNVNSSNFCAQLKKELDLQTPNDEKGYYHFEPTDKIKILIKKHINEDFNILLKNFEKFFNAKISVAKVLIKRNYNIDKFKNEVYSNNYHVDHNTYNHFKLFINLMDTEKKHGPLHIYSKGETKNFVVKKNYIDRNNYINEELDDKLYVNTGKLGESFLADTSACLHKAGKVEFGEYRDILFITFITVPKKINTDHFFYYDEIYPGTIWQPIGGSHIIKIAKPKSLRKTLSRFLEYYNNKLN